MKGLSPRPTRHPSEDLDPYFDRYTGCLVDHGLRDDDTVGVG